MIFHGVTRQICQTGHIPAEKINNGHCYDWARLAIQHCPSAQLFYVRRLIPHAFIYLAGHWFDAQVPNGIKHWRQLPLFKPCQELFHAKDLIHWQPGDRFWHRRNRYD